MDRVATSAGGGWRRLTACILVCALVVQGIAFSLAGARLATDAALITIIDGHPATLSWLGAVAPHRTYPLGVGHFGQSGDIPDLYRVYGLDADAILDAAARACLERRWGQPE